MRCGGRYWPAPLDSLPRLLAARDFSLSAWRALPVRALSRDGCIPRSVTCGVIFLAPSGTITTADPPLAPGWLTGWGGAGGGAGAAAGGVTGGFAGDCAALPGAAGGMADKGAASAGEGAGRGAPLAWLPPD
ncbi:MAG TPA: hypothetical protein DHV59_08385 [Oxalobacteraceae bacterium]|nr:hypothetical protein [Oxalobacteraceae bacterium]